MDKKTLRKKMLEERNRMTREEQLSLSYAIMEKTVSHYEFRNAEEILFYASYQSEVVTDGMIEYAFMLGKKVYCPRVISDEGKEWMEFFRIFSMNDLKQGYHGIREPEPIPDRKFIPSANKALLIMPGAVFDRGGHRIGYGKGFYDKFLAEKKEAFSCKIALAYDFQLLTEIPYEKHDAVAEMIVTQKDILDIR